MVDLYVYVLEYLFIYFYPRRILLYIKCIVKYMYKLKKNPPKSTTSQFLKYGSEHWNDQNWTCQPCIIFQESSSHLDKICNFEDAPLGTLSCCSRHDPLRI